MVKLTTVCICHNSPLQFRNKVKLELMSAVVTFIFEHSSNLKMLSFKMELFARTIVFFTRTTYLLTGAGVLLADGVRLEAADCMSCLTLSSRSTGE